MLLLSIIFHPIRAYRDLRQYRALHNFADGLQKQLDAPQMNWFSLDPECCQRGPTATNPLDPQHSPKPIQGTNDKK